MPNVTAIEAGRHFGKILRDAQSDPVFISKDGKQAAVLLSFDAFLNIVRRDRKTIARPILEKLLAESIERRSELYQALSNLD